VRGSKSGVLEGLVGLPAAGAAAVALDVLGGAASSEIGVPDEGVPSDGLAALSEDSDLVLPSAGLVASATGAGMWRLSASRDAGAPGRLTAGASVGWASAGSGQAEGRRCGGGCSRTADHGGPAERERRRRRSGRVAHLRRRIHGGRRSGGRDWYRRRG
jgi:hypothetical protein